METSESTQNGPPINARRTPKSRNGCMRCKAKRLKCDERKPECYQCNRKNIACPGYKAKPLVWSTKHEKLLVPNTTSPLLPPQQAVPPSQQPGESPPTRQDPEISNPLDATTSQQQIEGNQDGNTPMFNLSSPGRRSSTASSPSQTSVRRDSIPTTDSLSAIRQQLHRSTVPEFLLHIPTMLVEYYFNYVCQIFSSFDGTLNPFRSTVAKLWDGSAPIYYAIQSMAAAYLSNHFPRMSPVGVQMQRETYRYLYQVQQGVNQNENLDKTLLTVLLIGQTTAWHDPKDLGLVHLKTAKRLNRRRIEQQMSQATGTTIDTRIQRQNAFFEQCILYWDMLAGFVEDDVDEFGFGDFGTIESASLLGDDANGSSDAKENIFPHPWTGVAPKVQRLFAQVGRLIRSYRKSIAEDAASLDFLSLDVGFDIQYSQDSATTIEAIAKAQSLEEELLAFEPPSVSNLVDAGDENTPVQQYIHLAEAYRCAALLEIYRIFPSVLLRRVPLTNTSLASSSNDATQQAFDFLLMPSSQPPEEFLISLALHTISLLEKLPPNSGTRCLQPIVIIAAATELRFSPASIPDPTAPFASGSSVFNSLTMREVDIASARRFVVTRLQEFQLSLPAKPVVIALQLIQETWARADMGQDMYWMDVMAEMGWASIFG